MLLDDLMDFGLIVALVFPLWVTLTHVDRASDPDQDHRNSSILIPNTELSL